MMTEIFNIFIDALFAPFVLITEWSWLGLIPAAGFGLLYFFQRSRKQLIIALLWALYALYETGMKLRILCTGECNIRIDMIVIAPVLIVFSVVVIYKTLRKKLI